MTSTSVCTRTMRAAQLLAAAHAGWRALWRGRRRAANRARRGGRSAVPRGASCAAGRSCMRWTSTSSGSASGGVGRRRSEHAVVVTLRTAASRAMLITDAFSANASRSRTQGARKLLIDRVMDCVREGGNVLLPVDTASRVFELMLLLEAHWERERSARHAALALLHGVVHRRLGALAVRVDGPPTDARARGATCSS